jgi:nucleotide-binding universal stress UspA family protein
MTRTIVVAVDWSLVAKRAMRLAANLALSMGARLVLVHVRTGPIPPASSVVPSESSARSSGAEETAAAWATEVRNSGVPEVQTVLLDGPPVDALLNYVETNPPDLLVFGRRGHSTGTRMLLGGVTSSVLQHAQCPVLVVP